MGEIRRGFSAIMVWGLAFILITAIAVAAFSALQPIVVKYRTDVNRASQGYVESKQQLLLSLVEDYYDLDAKIAEFQDDADTVESLEAQQLAIVSRINKEANLLDSGDVPQSVRTFIREHPSH